MTRLILAATVLGGMAVVAHPYLSNAKDAPPTTQPSTSVASSSSSSAQPELASSVAAPLPATQPAAASFASRFKVIRGTEGFWRLGQDQTGAWWFLTPKDQLEFLNTVTTVQPVQTARDPYGPHYLSRDFDEKANNLDPWARATLARIRDMGFKGLGAWCNPIFHNYDVPITRDLNVWDYMDPASHRLYSPNWQPTAEKAIADQVKLLKDNKSLVGYYTDNELDWGESGAGPKAYFDHLDKSDPNRREVVKVMKSIWPTIADFNRDWDTKLAAYDDVETLDVLPHEPAGTYDRLFSAWLSHLATDYFRITTAAIRKNDPNHLVLGVRFKGYAPKEVVAASRGFTDAESLNTYVGDAKLDRDMFRWLYDLSGQPLIITEYSFHALDGRSGDRDTVGFNAQVPDQQARADGYRLFTTRLARVPWIIGADWFQWADEPPSGRTHDGEDVNFGIVDVDDRPYEKLVDAVRETSAKLDDVHARSAHDDASDVWRESFATKPVMQVPYLTTPPTINGELSDWPAAAKLPGVRRSQTVGLERNEMPLPNIYLGWTKRGLYLGMEVFDNDIEGAPAKGWWWTRDHVEFWVSTRPVSSDQNTYNVYDHQFFFVPNAFPENDGISGIVGQWHREGDALKDNLIPHPDVREAVRVLPDRYVVEMLIPAKALHGFDPEHQPALAFNFHARNFQHAIDYFWSAPKEVITQLRPSTWGTLYLQPDSGTAKAADRRVDEKTAAVAAGRD